ncbi:chitin catabolic cascade sensor histidine kinase chiS [Vibrio ishigakensis]|uniref:histidine kinase n=1 Tax=Vibrio ishigakensis TaxID=1481914 RepID=A0A0B8QCA0_9VIBR|nr:chitin catabolic cascade sensor histidine kinase chiS [Vibrio ishigakensis]
MLLDQHQNLLAGSPDPLEEIIALSQTEPQADLTQYVDNDNETIMASFAPVSVHGMQWSVFSQSPEDLAFARVSNLQMLFVGIVVVALVLVFITSAYLSNLITRPLLKLTWAAERISAGHLEEKVEGAEREDEIGRLAVSFERMQRSVREKIELIEKQKQELEYNLQTIAEQNQELQLADKLKDEFLATTSHELRTPLHGMIGVAQTLLSGAHGDIPSAQRFQLEIIINSGNRLSNLVDDLLDYHKMRYGDLKLDQHAVSVASSAQLVVELSNHLIEDKPVRLLNHIDPRLPMVSADPQRLEQVLYNLVGNAIKFTNEGKVVLNATEQDNSLVIEVIDTGRGIPEQDLETIFEPLMQSQSARYQHGTGLGLSISKRLIELMDGELSVSSQPLLGTTFRLTLPLATEEQLNQQVEGTHFKAEITERIKLSEESSALPENPDGELILIADDEPVNLKILESFLRIEGYRVECASDGQQALDKVAEQKPAVLLLDIMMPELSGYEVCEKLRTKYSRHELPIIMLTALNQTEDKIKGFECGANDYLVKPFNKQELSARIGVHIDASVSEERKQQNLVLSHELSQLEQTEAILLDTQTRLLEQLENTPEAIVCVNDKHKISYANQTATQLFKRSIEQLKRSSIEEFIGPKYLSFDQPHRSIDIDIFVDEEKQSVPSDIFTLPLETGMRGMFIFNNDPHKVNQRVADLEVALDAMSHYAFAGDKSQLDLIRELGGDFSKLVEKVEGEKNGKQQTLRQLLVECMT